MPRQSSGQSFPLPPPFLGQVDKVPLLELQNPYCEILQNFNVDTGKVYLRNGDSWHGRLAANNSDQIVKLKGYQPLQASGKLIAMMYKSLTGMQWYDITAGGSGTLLHTDAGITADIEIHTSDFNGSLYFWGEFQLLTAKGKRYDGTSWASTPYTFSATFSPFMGYGHRNRHYMAGRYSSSIAYGGVDATTGTATVVDFGGSFGTRGYISTLRSVSISQGLDAKSLFVMINNLGDVLSYDGAYPASADWRLAGRFRIPPPITFEQGIDVDGDWLQITPVGLVSVRDLFMKGNRLAVQESITAPIASRWRQLVEGQDSFGLKPYIRGIWDAAKNRILVLFPSFVRRDGGVDGGIAGWLVYDMDRQAWFEHASYCGGPIYSCEPFEGSVYYSRYSIFTHPAIYKKEGADDYLDAAQDGVSSGLPYAYQIRSAPLPLPKTNNTRVTGLELITKGDYYGVTNVSLRSNLGVSTTASTKIPDQGTGLRMPYVNIGTDGTVIQYDIAHDGGPYAPASEGAEFYGVNVHFEQGGVR